MAAHDLFELHTNYANIWLNAQHFFQSVWQITYIDRTWYVSKFAKEVLKFMFQICFDTKRKWSLIHSARECFEELAFKKNKKRNFKWLHL